MRGAGFWSGWCGRAQAIGRFKYVGWDLWSDGVRRMARDTNAFSERWENLEAAHSLWLAFYNSAATAEGGRWVCNEERLAECPWALEMLLKRDSIL